MITNTYTYHDRNKIKRHYENKIQKLGNPFHI